MDESKGVDILVDHFGVNEEAIEKCLAIVSRENGTSRKIVLQIMVNDVYSPLIKLPQEMFERVALSMNVRDLLAFIKTGEI